TGRTGRLRQDVARITQAIADEFERLIQRAPEQWHMYQPNWPSDRPADTAGLAEAAGPAGRPVSPADTTAAAADAGGRG
ncbi:MAG TPA: hypothetical protein VGG23_04675, partial [Acidimicrobiales bacterium]